jgi:hypothetical protein
VRKRLLPIAFVGALFVFIFSCTKLDTTTLGQDLIPAVDNITTFADTLDITTTQGYFLPDTTKVLYNETHAVGHIETDPLFGKSDAAIYFQLKPSFYPFYFGAAGDTTRNPGGGPGPTLPVDNVGVDSVFMCLAYTGYYGDTLTPLQLEVRQLYDDKFRDSVGVERNVGFQPTTLGSVLGSVTLDIPSIKNQIKFAHDKDSVTNQIRIKITDPAFINNLYNNDSSAVGAFHNDSLFRRAYNGFAITRKAGGTGNAFVYVSLTDAKTRLEIHYRKKKISLPDTTYASFALYPTITVYGQPSSTGNGIVRDRTGTPSATGLSDYLFLQTSGPGTYANLSIPTLGTRPNQIIHRAAILIESVPNLASPTTDALFPPPDYLYLDLKDTSATGGDKWKPVYHDLNPSSPYDPDFKTGYPFFPLSGVDPTNYGGNLKYKPDGLGNKIGYYNINVTRYVQQIVTKQTPNYPMRMWAPYSLIYPQYSAEIIPYYNLIANGRVRLASGSHPDKTKKMRMVIIYSKIP